MTQYVHPLWVLQEVSSHVRCWTMRNSSTVLLANWVPLSLLILTPEIIFISRSRKVKSMAFFTSSEVQWYPRYFAMTFLIPPIIVLHYAWKFGGHRPLSLIKPSPSFQRNRLFCFLPECRCILCPFPDFDRRIQCGDGIITLLAWFL